MKDTILSISGKPGLFRLVSRGRAAIIIETIDERKRRSSASMRDRVTALNDVAMYTEADEVPLMTVFQTLFDARGGKKIDLVLKTATRAELEAVMTEALPTFDRDRVHQSDMKKLIQWYNILVENGYSEFAEKDESASDEPAEA